jgi:hypothetical protein
LLANAGITPDQDTTVLSYYVIKSDLLTPRLKKLHIKLIFVNYSPFTALANSFPILCHLVTMFDFNTLRIKRENCYQHKVKVM